MQSVPSVVELLPGKLLHGGCELLKERAVAAHVGRAVSDAVTLQLVAHLGGAAA